MDTIAKGNFLRWRWYIEYEEVEKAYYEYPNDYEINHRRNF
jgi:hypothetical protein